MSDYLRRCERERKLEKIRGKVRNGNGGGRRAEAPKKKATKKKAATKKKPAKLTPSLRRVLNDLSAAHAGFTTGNLFQLRDRDRKLIRKGVPYEGDEIPDVRELVAMGYARITLDNSRSMDGYPMVWVAPTAKGNKELGLR